MASAVTLLASTTVASSGTATASIAVDVSKAKAALFMLDVTAAATDAADTLDVYIQHSPDAGTTYDDFVHFTQVLGNGGALKHQAQWTGYAALPESELRVPADGSLAAGVLHGPVGDDWRIKYRTVDGGTTGNMSFTFSIKGRLING